MLLDRQQIASALIEQVRHGKSANRKSAGNDNPSHGLL
jgi:hypothetical protein